MHNCTHTHTHRKFPNSSQCGKLWQHSNLESWTLGIPILVLIEAGKNTRGFSYRFSQQDCIFPWSGLILPRSYMMGWLEKPLFLSHKCLFHPSLPSEKKYEDWNGIVLKWCFLQDLRHELSVNVLKFVIKTSLEENNSHSFWMHNKIRIILS